MFPIGRSRAVPARAPLVLAIALLLAGCGTISTTPPAPTPADFTGIAGFLANAGVTVTNVVSGDAGCADPDITKTAIGFDARGADQATPVRIHIYIFRNHDTYVRERASVDRCAASFVTDLGGLDILYNNAGLALGLGKAQEASLADWETMIETNVTGLVILTRRVLPGMVERDRGHIINIGSTAGEWPYPGGNVYGATKAFVRQFSLNLRADLFGTRVRVTEIEPGLVGGTEFSAVRFKGDTAKAATPYQDTEPLTPEDIADAVHWVATRPARVNINTLQVMPVVQSFAPLRIHRG